MKALRVGFWLVVVSLVVLGCGALTEIQELEIKQATQRIKSLATEYQTFAEVAAADIETLRKDIESFKSRIEQLVEKQKAGKLTKEEVKQLTSDLYGAIEATTAKIDEKKQQVEQLYYETSAEMSKINKKIEEIIADAKKRGFSTWETWLSLIGALGAGLLVKSPGPVGVLKKIPSLLGVKKKKAA